jgi:hypothetical protein
VWKLLPLILLTGCTYVAVSGNGSHDVVVQPATLVPVMAAQDTVLSDRASDQDGSGGLALGDEGEIDADQTATAVPTISIPMTGGPPVTVPLEGVDSGELLERAGGIVSSGHLPELKDEPEETAPEETAPEETVPEETPE